MNSIIAAGPAKAAQARADDENQKAAEGDEATHAAADTESAAAMDHVTAMVEAAAANAEGRQITTEEETADNAAAEKAEKEIADHAAVGAEAARESQARLEKSVYLRFDCQQVQNRNMKKSNNAMKSGLDLEMKA